MRCDRWLTTGLLMSGMIASVVAAQAPADTSAVPNPRSFTYKTDGASLSAVLDEFAKQTGTKVDKSKAEAERTMRIDCKDTPFWEALEKIARESDHRLTTSQSGRGLALLGGAEITYREAPASFDRVFRLAARKVQSVSELDADRAYTEVTLTLMWEPGFAVFLVEQPGRSVVAKDNNDQDLRLGDDNGGRVAVSGGTVELPLRLANVPRAAKTIKLLEGKFGIIGAAKMLEFSFPKTAASKESAESKQEDVTVRFRTDFKDKSDLWAARVEFEYPPGGPQLESFEASAWLIDNNAWLTHSDGKKRLDCNGGFEIVAQNERKAVVIYRFTDDVSFRLGKPEDWTFHVRTPSRLINTEMKFRLENIPLP